MSNRFHSKFHRQNHHTYVNNYNADAGHDPIASKEQPFQGDFVLSGALSSFAPNSAVAGYFYSNNTALCAWAGKQAIYAFSKGNTTNTGIYVYSTGIALSAQADVIAGNFQSDQFGIAVFGGNKAIRSHSNNIGLDSYGFNYGGIFNSMARGLSSYGAIYGIETTSNEYGINARGASGYGGSFFSNARGLSAWGGNIGLDVVSNSRAINARAPLEGIVVSSLGKPLSTGGGGVNVFNNKTGIFKTPDQSSSYNFEVGGGGGAYFDGNSYIKGNLTVIGDLSAAGIWSYLDTKVILTSSMRILNEGTDAAVSINQKGNYPILQCFDADISTTIPSFIIDGANKGWVALGTTKPQAPFYIVKNSTESSNQPQFVITDNNSDPKRIVIGLETSTNDQPFIGTQSDHHLLFQTASSTQMFLTSSGRVGVGHASYKDTLSSTRLDVNGAITLRGETLNLTHTETANSSGVYLFLPGIAPDYGITDYALIRQIGGAGLDTGVPYGNYHLALDLHNDNINTAGQGWLYNQQFSIRNVGSDGAGNDVIQSRVKIDGRGNVGINLEDCDMSNDNYKLTVHGGISAKGGIIALSASTFHGDLTLNHGNLTLNNNDLKIINPTYNSQNALTFNQGDTRYGVLSCFYKTSTSTLGITDVTTWLDPDIKIYLPTGKYLITAQIVYNVNNTFGIKNRYSFDGTATWAASEIQNRIVSTTPTVCAFNVLPAINSSLQTSTGAVTYINTLNGCIDVTSGGWLEYKVNAHSTPTGFQYNALANSYIKAEKIA